MKKRRGLSVDEFKIGDKAVLANSYLTTKSENQWEDTFTVVETALTFGKWKAVRNDRTGHGYVMGDGEYCLAD